MLITAIIRILHFSRNALISKDNTQPVSITANQLLQNYFKL
jgi:hypothetical protein